MSEVTAVQQYPPHMKLRVMLIDREAGRSTILEQTLIDSGCEVVAKVSVQEDLLARVKAVRPDIILVDLDSPDRATLESLHSLNRDLPHPVVMFAEEGDTGTIERAIRAGVSAYVVDGLSPRRLKPIMDVAIARFREYQALRKELDETRDKLADRKEVDKAKGLLMRRGMIEEEAYAALRKMAMDRNVKIGEAARMLIAAAELLG